MPISFGSFSGVIAFAKTAAGSLFSLFSEDPFYKKTSLILTTNKIQGSNNSVIVDSSANNYPVTGTVLYQGTFSPFSQNEGNWSASYTGTGTSVSSGLHTQIATEELTIECWVFPTETTSAGQTLLACMPSIVADNRLSVSLSGSYGKSVNFTYTTNSSTNAGVGSVAEFTLNEWNYISVSTKPDGNCFIGINGTVEQFQNLNFANQTGSQGSGWGIGGAQSPYDTHYRGFISNLRVSKTALRTTNYDVPSAPLPTTDVSNPFDLQLLTYQSNNNRVNGGSVVLSTPGNKIVPFGPFNYIKTGDNMHGSCYFDGNELSVVNNTTLNLSGTTWTIDGWMYPNGDYSNYNTLISKRIPSSSTTAWELYTRVGSGVFSYYNGTNYESSVTPEAYAWNHFAAVYDGLNINLYLNGVRVLQSTVDNNEVDTPVLIGSFSSYSEHYKGYMSNLRIVKGQQLYSGTTYTIPSSPTIEIVDKTSLLLNFKNYAIYDEICCSSVRTLGTPQANVDMTDTHTGSGSIYCSGTQNSPSPYIYVLNPNPSFSSEYTWETWYKNKDSSDTLDNIITSNSDVGYGGVIGGFGVLRSSSYGFCLWAVRSGFTDYGALYTGYFPPYNEWHHLAVTRDISGTVRFFVDGVLYSYSRTGAIWGFSGTDYGPWPATDPGLTYFQVAQYITYPSPGSPYGTSSKFQIEKMRITRDCRYTSNFTVPTY